MDRAGATIKRGRRQGGTMLKSHLGKFALARFMLATSMLGVAALLGIAVGIAAGYVLWGRTPDWFDGHDVRSLPPGPSTDLIAYGERLVRETPRHIGAAAADEAMRYAG